MANYQSDTASTVALTVIWITVFGVIFGMTYYYFHLDAAGSPEQAPADTTINLSVTGEQPGSMLVSSSASSSY